MSTSNDYRRLAIACFICGLNLGQKAWVSRLVWPSNFARPRPSRVSSSLTQRLNERLSTDGLAAHCKFLLTEHLFVHLIKPFQMFSLSYPPERALLYFSANHLYPRSKKVEVHARGHGGVFGIGIKHLLLADLTSGSVSARCYASPNGRVQPEAVIFRFIRYARRTPMTRQVLILMRIAACAALALLALASVAEWNFPALLAPEAQSYQAEYPDALRSGLSPSYALGHLLLVAGCACAVSGVLLVCLSRRSGIIPLAASAPAIAAGASLFDFGPTYPSLEPTYIVILWCSASAAWASALTLALVFLKTGRRAFGTQEPV